MDIAMEGVGQIIIIENFKKTNIFIENLYLQIIISKFFIFFSYYYKIFFVFVLILFFYYNEKILYID